MSLIVHFHAWKTPVDYIIQWRTNGNVTHASLEFDGLFVEALAMKGVVKHKKRRNDIVCSIEIPCDSVEYNQMKQFALRQCKKKYDWLGILWFGGRQSFKNDPNRWFCSELVYSTLYLTKKVPETQKNVHPELLQNILNVLYKNRLGVS